MELKVKARIVQGIEKFYPICEEGKSIARSMRKRAFTKLDLQILQKRVTFHIDTQRA